MNTKAYIYQFIDAIKGSSPMHARNFLLPEHKFNQKLLLQWRYMISPLVNIKELSSDDNSLAISAIKPTNRGRGVHKIIRISVAIEDDIHYVSSVEYALDTQVSPEWHDPSTLSNDRLELVNQLKALVLDACYAYQHTEPYSELTTQNENELRLMEPVGAYLLDTLMSVRLMPESVYMQYSMTNGNQQFHVRFAQVDEEWKIAAMGTVETRAASLINEIV